MTPFARHIGLGLLAVAALVSCTEVEIPIEGERLDVRAPLSGESPEPAPEPSRDVALSLSAQRANADWTHKAGGPAHRIQHPAFGGRFELLWSADIGVGNRRKRRLTADPIIVGNVIFTLDSEATVTATRTTGERLWQIDLTPAGDNSSDASGGGLAYSDGRLFVSSSFGFLTAINPATGGRFWTQQLDAAASGAPTAIDGQVFLISADSRAWAVDTSNGRVLWNLPGAPSQSGLTGAPSPAVSGARSRSARRSRSC